MIYEHWINQGLIIIIFLGIKLISYFFFLFKAEPQNDTDSWVTTMIVTLRYGVIQQLRGPNFTQIWTHPPFPRVDMVHATYPLSRDQAWTFYWSPFPLFLST